ncbi:hypothetical protein JH06_4401 [Blastocystis sp. subtype 4]|uniref:hypothetical protein n=1 Tax=Blastocystis sp. subtype 4 TaxID=944170 RepID=UPI000711BC3D|nr:hypothetical protein JH06_4401 [Blastocystis sp. subtype 4]KNB42620.1 hypothetical protein JH06_4401 [Blastocystis sp. subtype 4]|eukprot:XP_014526063.1 hypothetical protein JH06_4401 [Blastocystis sp. subtype 4]
MQTRYHIKSVSVNSFKSFGNNTTIHFTEQLTCIVGKNGCGKSALIDAICCCLGVDVKRLQRLRQAVSDQLGLRIAPDPLFVIQQNRIQSFCCNDSDFLINFIMEVQICH